MELDGAAVLPERIVGVTQVAERVAFSTTIAKLPGGAHRGFEPPDPLARVEAQGKNICSGIRVLGAESCRGIREGGVCSSPSLPGSDVRPLGVEEG